MTSPLLNLRTAARLAPLAAAALIALAAWPLGDAPAPAQGFAGPPPRYTDPAGPAAFQGAPAGPVVTLQAEAFAGEPLGVGRWTLLLGRGSLERVPRVRLTEADGRVLYPAMTLRELPPPDAQPQPLKGGRRIGGGALLRRLRQAVENTRQRIDPPVALDIDFLFTGNAPLTLELHWPATAGERPISITLPVARGGAVGPHRELLRRWYESYAKDAAAAIRTGDYPPAFQTFMAETMARRLDLSPIDLRPAPEAGEASSTPLSTLELLAGTESLRDSIAVRTLREATLGGGQRSEPELGPLPAPPAWAAIAVPETPEGLPVESIAAAVPPDCFYLRFGSFSNHLWFRELTAGRGAGIAQMLTFRGSDARPNDRIERMLNTKTTLIARLFGDAIINDIAIIGHDLYQQDGPSMAVLFEAKDAPRLLASLDSERLATAEAMGDAGVRLETLQIAGHDVTLLSDRENSIRSFRAVDGDYVLLSTSREIVENFLAVRGGGESLAATPGFRYSRLLMPLENDYDMFAYFSPQFFQQLVAPERYIELRRRYAAKSRIAAAQMASLMAKAEGSAAADTEALIAEGYLPPGFQDSADGSRIVRGEAGWLDSRRGGAGNFLPIDDVPVLGATPHEAALYRDVADYYSREWVTAEPLMVGLRRYESPLGPKAEQVAIEAYVTPLELDKFGQWGRYLAPPVQTLIATPPDDVVSAQVHMAGDAVLGGRAPDYVLFAGLKDNAPPPPAEDPSLLSIWLTLSRTPFYLGAWPQPGYLDLLPLGLAGSTPDALGFSRALIGMWRWQGDGFSVLSFDRGILEVLVRHLGLVAAPDPAQIRVVVKDLEATQLAGWVNTYWYRRGFEVSRGNLRLLDGLQQQFKLPADQALLTAEQLLDTDLICPLGGDYVVVESASPERFWTSTAMQSLGIEPSQEGRPRDLFELEADELFPPSDYQADWLGWLRGLRAHATQVPEGLIVLATADLERLPPPAAAEGSEPPLPALNFDLFSLPGQLFGGAAAAQPPQPEKEQREF